MTPSEPRIDLVPVTPTHALDAHDAIRLEGAHGGEIVRAVWVDAQVRNSHVVVNAL